MGNVIRKKQDRRNRINYFSYYNKWQWGEYHNWLKDNNYTGVKIKLQIVNNTGILKCIKWVCVLVFFLKKKVEKEVNKGNF